MAALVQRPNPRRWVLSAVRFALLACFSLPAHIEAFARLGSSCGFEAPRRVMLLSTAVVFRPELAIARENFCEAAVSHLSGPAGDVFLVGVTHLSNRSADLARKAVREATPDLVMVELDSSRLRIKSSSTQNASQKVARDQKPPPTPERAESGLGPLAAAQQAVASAVSVAATAALRTGLELVYSVAEKFANTSAGSEMIAAIEEAAKVGATVMLGDQSAELTLKRLAEEGGKVDMGRLEDELKLAVPELQGSLSFQAMIESSTDQATARRLRRAFKFSAPGVFSALVGERDAFMAGNLAKALRAGKRSIVAIVGSIHVQGIEESLQRQADLKVIDSCM